MGDTTIQNYVTIKPDQKNATKLFTSIPQEKVYATVKCTNGAGLTHTCSSDGVKIIQSPPSVDDVMLELLTSSATQYESRDHYHGNKTEIRFRWTGFKCDDGVESYLVYFISTILFSHNNKINVSFKTVLLMKRRKQCL
jgi:hypothetical protein